MAGVSTPRFGRSGVRIEEVEEGVVMVKEW
jgi:hypothetical protein